VVFVQQNLTDPVQRVAKAGGGLAEVEFLQYDQSLRHAAGIQWALGKGYAVLLFSEAIFADGRAMSVLMAEGSTPRPPRPTKFWCRSSIRAGWKIGKRSLVFSLYHRGHLLLDLIADDLIGRSLPVVTIARR